MGDFNTGVAGQQQRPNPADIDTGVNRAARITGFLDPRLQALVQSLFPQFAQSPNVLAPVTPGPAGGAQITPNPVPATPGPSSSVPLASNPNAATAPGPSTGGAPLATPNPFYSLVAANPIAPVAAPAGTMPSASPTAAPLNPAQTNVAIDPTVAFVMSLLGGGEAGNRDIGGGEPKNSPPENTGTKQEGGVGGLGAGSNSMGGSNAPIS